MRKSLSQLNMKEEIKVLLVDDDPIANFINQSIIREYITKDVDLAINGQQGIRVLQDLIDHNNSPKFILLDLNMPVMDGFEFLDAFKKMKLDKEIQIVILTSFLQRVNTASMMKFYNIKGYLKKPMTRGSVDLLRMLDII